MGARARRPQGASWHCLGWQVLAERSLRWFSSFLLLLIAGAHTLALRPPSRRRARANLVPDRYHCCPGVPTPSPATNQNRIFHLALFLPQARAARELAAPRRAHFDKERSVKIRPQLPATVSNAQYPRPNLAMPPT